MKLHKHKAIQAQPLPPPQTDFYMQSKEKNAEEKMHNASLNAHLCFCSMEGGVQTGSAPSIGPSALV